MRPITIRLPQDMIDAIDQATEDEGHPSASDLVRVILRHYLRHNHFYPTMSTRTLPQPDDDDSTETATP